MFLLESGGFELYATGFEIMRMPIRLKKSPLVDALFELRFKAVNSAGEVLPGILFSELKDDYPDVHALPIANVPKDIRAREPNLRYGASHRLVGQGKHLQVGERVVTVSYGFVYPGWDEMKQSIVRVLGVLEDTSLITEIERFSFRYVNIIDPRGSTNQLSLIKANISVLDEDPVQTGIQLRVERRESNFLHIIQIGTDASAVLPSDRKRSGLLLDIDTICTMSGPLSVQNIDPLLDEGHRRLETVFFSFLTKETLEACEPIWDDQND